MAEPLKTMLVNPGDPITSELLSNIVSNINLINSMARSSIVDPDAPGSGGAQIIDSGRPSVDCLVNGEGSLPITFKKKFTSVPNITCTIWQTSGKNFLNQKYIPVVTSTSTTGFTVRMLPVGATMGGNVYVQWIAVSPS